MRFPLPWSHYVRLLALRSEEGRKFYETEALRCGWTVRQLDRQISTQFYERTAQAAVVGVEYCGGFRHEHCPATKKSLPDNNPAMRVIGPW